MKDLLELYWAYLKIGCINFGGGYAMLPLLERELVNKRGWTTMEELRDYFAIGQCTPGLIALNVSTFIGQKRKGAAGAIVAMLGFLTAPIAIILVIAAFLRNFAELEVVQHAFAGIRVCVCVLIVQAVIRLWILRGGCAILRSLHCDFRPQRLLRFRPAPGENPHRPAGHPGRRHRTGGFPDPK